MLWAPMGEVLEEFQVVSSCRTNCLSMTKGEIEEFRQGFKKKKPQKKSVEGANTAPTVPSG